MSVRITWNPYSTLPSDVTEVVVVRSTSLTNEAAFENELNANGRASTALDFITTDQQIIGNNITVTSSVVDYDDLAADQYYYCIAAKNDVGYTVGANGAQSDVPSPSGAIEGGVARIDVS